MPKPIAVCIENLTGSSPAQRYLRCVALGGRQPGLRLDRKGQVHWQGETGAACELWVSADERLVLYRQAGMAPVTVSRAGRSLEVPCEKPVMLADQDELAIGRRRFRLHLHGLAGAISAPAYLPVEAGGAGRRGEPAVGGVAHAGSGRAGSARAAAARAGSGRAGVAKAGAALAGAAALLAGCIEVRETPPAPLPPEGTLTAEMAPTPTIEVRETPPEPMVIVTDAPSPTPTIEVRDFPPTATVAGISFPEVTIAEALLGDWQAGQVYEFDGVSTWITGTLTLQKDSYLFKPFQAMSIPSADGALDFLFAHPQGEVEFIALDWIAPDAPFMNIYPGSTLLGIRFSAGGEALATFDVRVGYLDDLVFYSTEHNSELYRVTKEIVTP